MMQIILFVVLAIIIIALIYAYLAEKKYSISSEIIINRSQIEVYNYLKNLRNQEKWSKWVMADPNVKLTYTGVEGEVGFISAWESFDKNVGIGEQEIKKLTPNSRMDVEIRFKKPFEGISLANNSIESLSENQTKVTTVFYSETPFPMNLMIPFIKKMLQKDMNTNSINLKGQLEK